MTNLNIQASPTIAAIELRGVTKRYGSVLAVDGLDLTIRSGEFLTLLGPSGCGKTSTLRIIGGFEFPQEGTVYLDGEDVTSKAPFHRRVNTVFQRYALFPHMTITENIAYGLHGKGVDRSRSKQIVKEMLTLVRLSGVENRRPRELSGGQQQRVALARALAMEPKVLLLDEPLGSLDYKLRKQMQVELKDIHRKLGTTFVYVTHDQEEALAMSDRICVMSGGHIVQSGSPTEIYDHPETRYVADFVGNMNFVEGKLWERHGSTGSVQVDGIGKLISDHIEDGILPGDLVTLGIRNEDIAVLHLDPPGENVVVAKCTEQLPIGSVTRLVLQVGDWQFNVDASRETSGDLRGSEIMCHWPSHRVHVYKSGQS
jgi:spermidine/putrescine transport system ATP-binding protein